MRLRSPMRRIGVTTERWQRWREKSRRAVGLRAGFKCEGCGTNLRPLEWAHLFSRGQHVIAEPWCSLPELTAALCSSKYELGCHESIDRNLAPGLLLSLRQLALMRLMGRFKDLHFLNYGQPLDGAREAVRQLEEQGWGFDPERCEIVKR